MERGTPRGLPAGMGLAVYRITQEALTNVLKHAGPDPQVTVVLRWLADRVVLEVADDGRGAAAASDGLGQGLVGMRERAAHVRRPACGPGPRPGGGSWCERACPPLTGPRSGRGQQPGRVAAQREGAT